MQQTIIQFGRWETASILINVLLVKIFLGLPGLMSEACGSALWLSAILSAAIMYLFILLIVWLYDHFEGKDLFAIAELVGGRPLRWVVAALVLATLLARAPIVLRLTVEGLLVATPFPIPPLLATLLLAFAMLFAAYRGVEGIARLHAIFVPAILAALVFIYLFTAHTFHASNLFPFWGLGMGNTLWQGARFTSLYSDMLFLFLLYPYVNDKRQFKQSAWWGVGLGSLFLVLTNLGFILALEYPQNAQFVMPVYQLSRIISFGQYTQNLESVFLPFWLVSSMLYLSLSLFFVSRTLQNGFGAKYHKLGIFPALLAIVLLNYVPKNMMEAVQFGAQVDLILMATGLVIPSMILFAAILKQRREGRLAR